MRALVLAAVLFLCAVSAGCGGVGHKKPKPPPSTQQSSVPAKTDWRATRAKLPANAAAGEYQNFGDGTNDGTVNEVPLGGGRVRTLATGQTGPTSVAVDSTHAYWVDYGTYPDYSSAMNKVRLGGGRVVSIASGVRSIYPFALAVGP
jgi:hypothetical protein